MVEVSNSLTPEDVLFSAFMLANIALFSILAADAQARIWRKVNRFNGERRARQHRITVGRSHLR